MLALVVAGAGCGSDSDSAAVPETTEAGGGATTSVDAGTSENACPTAGCQITIDDVVNDGEELRITWQANFVPDASRNHIHVYWDTYTPDQVSNDAAARGVQQGEWVPTDAFPDYVTEGATSTAERGNSTTICVTAGDNDHNVIDATVQDCFPVADLL